MMILRRRLRRFFQRKCQSFWSWRSDIIEVHEICTTLFWVFSTNCKSCFRKSYVFDVLHMSFFGLGEYMISDFSRYLSWMVEHMIVMEENKYLTRLFHFIRYIYLNYFISHWGLLNLLHFLILHTYFYLGFKKTSKRLISSFRLRWIEFSFRYKSIKIPI